MIAGGRRKVVSESTKPPEKNPGRPLSGVVGQESRWEKQRPEEQEVLLCNKRRNFENHAP